MVRELGTYREEFFTGASTQPVLDALERMVGADMIRRLWIIDAGLFTHDQESAKTIPNRMAWLRSPEFMGSNLTVLQTFAQQRSAEGIKKALIISMEGEATAPRALCGCFARREGYPEVQVIADIEPSLVQHVSEWADPRSTLVAVEHKTGDSLELRSLESHFWDQFKAALGNDAAKHFVAVTDPSSELAQLASRRRYLEVFENPPDMNGAYSAISFLGLLPAALMGVDLQAFTKDATRMAEACSPAVSIDQNPGLRLGAFIAGLADAGRNKLTLLCDSALSAFGPWVEQLVAGVSGRNRGVVPVVNEPVDSVDDYGADRCFVYVRITRDRSPLDDQVDTLVARGQPVARVTLRDTAELGGEFFRWEVATALVGAFFHLSPFDDSGVAASSAATRRFLDAFSQRNSLPKWHSVPPTADPIVELVRKTKAGDYVALSAFFEPTPERDRLFSEIRKTLRNKLGVATTLGYGSPSIHATSRLHTHGPSGVVQLVLWASDGVDIPAQPWSFATLRDAQTLGELQLMQHAGRKALRVQLPSDIDAGLASLLQRLNQP